LRFQHVRRRDSAVILHRIWCNGTTDFEFHSGSISEVGDCVLDVCFTPESGSRETPVAPPEEETAAVEADNELPADLVALNGS
jgi:hypothetical protein